MSKGLEALNRLRNHKPYDIEPNLDIIEKELKALEIIKDCCIVAEYPDNTYELAFCRKICIEKEEYELLKEVL